MHRFSGSLINKRLVPAICAWLVVSASGFGQWVQPKSQNSEAKPAVPQVTARLSIVSHCDGANSVRFLPDSRTIAVSGQVGKIQDGRQKEAGRSSIAGITGSVRDEVDDGSTLNTPTSGGNHLVSSMKESCAANLLDVITGRCVGQLSSKEHLGGGLM